MTQEDSTLTRDELDQVSLFQREYTTCECGGWDERFVSVGKARGRIYTTGVNLNGRSNHARACAARICREGGTP